jgi:molybdopterin-synthase adenylyltransferase
MNDDQLLRYSRQIMLPSVDVEGQCRLASARIAVVGAGGLGNPVGLYLAAAGVGHITLIDDDHVDISNLARQIAYTDSDVGLPKAQTLAREMRRRNPHVEILAVNARLTTSNALELLADTDVVLDCSDNYAARFAINDACLTLNVPAIFAAATAWQGQVFVCHPSHAASPCYECFNPSREELDASCARNGILGPVVGVIASQQAVEAMRVLLGMSFSPVLQLYDARDSEWHRIAMAPRASCPCRSK